MSLFDVLKYPISTPPTKEELSALPRDFLLQWMVMVKFNLSTDLVSGVDKETDIVSWIYECYTNDLVIPSDFNDLILLRKLIRDYSEPI